MVAERVSVCCWLIAGIFDDIFGEELLFSTNEAMFLLSWASKRESI
jgi:hypothetical protein